MKSVETRIERLEAAGVPWDLLDQMSDAELDEEFVRIYGMLDAAGVDQTESLLDLAGDPVLSARRQSWPMSTDIEALALKHAGVVFYDECADMSVDQVQSRVKAHVARLEGEDRNASKERRHGTN